MCVCVCVCVYVCVCVCVLKVMPLIHFLGNYKASNREVFFQLLMPSVNKKNSLQTLKHDEMVVDI